MLALAFNPDRSKFATGTLGGEVHIYDVADPAHPVALPNAQGWVYSLAFSSDGKLADAGLQQRAREKLDEVEERISDLETIRDNLSAAIDAGCDDLVACASADCCPIPFTAITIHPASATATDKETSR